MIPLETSMSWIFWDKYGDPINQRDSSICLWIDKLQINLKNFKQEWSKLTYRINNGSRLTADKERHWFKHLNQIFTKVNDAINFSSNAAETSFPNEEKESQNYSTEDSNDSHESDRATNQQKK